MARGMGFGVALGKAAPEAVVSRVIQLASGTPAENQP